LCRYLPEEMVYQKKMWFGYTVSQHMLLDMLHEEIATYIRIHNLPLQQLWRSPESKNINIEDIQPIFEVLLTHIWATQNGRQDEIIPTLYPSL
jgi:hypothetical protein